MVVSKNAGSFSNLPDHAGCKFARGTTGTDALNPLKEAAHWCSMGSVGLVSLAWFNSSVDRRPLCSVYSNKRGYLVKVSFHQV